MVKDSKWKAFKKVKSPGMDKNVNSPPSMITPDWLMHWKGKGSRDQRILYTEPEDHSQVLMDEGGFTIDERIFTDISADHLSKKANNKGIKSAWAIYQGVQNDNAKQLYNADGKGKIKTSF